MRCKQIPIAHKTSLCKEGKHSELLNNTFTSKHNYATRNCDLVELSIPLSTEFPEELLCSSVLFSKSGDPKNIHLTRDLSQFSPTEQTTRAPCVHSAVYSFALSLPSFFYPPSVFHGKEIHYLCPVPMDCHIALDAEGELCSVLFNLSKVFDTVPHQPLLQRPLPYSSIPTSSGGGYTITCPWSSCT